GAGCGGKREPHGEAAAERVHGADTSDGLEAKRTSNPPPCRPRQPDWRLRPGMDARRAAVRPMLDMDERVATREAGGQPALRALKHGQRTDTHVDRAPMCLMLLGGRTRRRARGG